MDEFVIEPHEVEGWLPLLRRMLPEEALQTLIAAKSVEHGDKRYVIRQVARMRPITPEEWRSDSQE